MKEKQKYKGFSPLPRVLYKFYLTVIETRAWPGTLNNMEISRNCVIPSPPLQSMHLAGEERFMKSYSE